MDKVQNSEWNDMRRDLKDVKDVLLLMKVKLVGNDDLDMDGLSQKFENHIIEDRREFKILNEKINPVLVYQERQQLIVGWSKKAVAFFITGLVLLGGFMQWLIATLISLK